MRFLKQSTAVDIALGPFLDSTDGITAKTALTISQADVRLKKNASAWAQKNETTSATHEENGWYEANLNTTDTDTLGVLMIAVHETGALPVWHEFMIAPANVYDSLFSTDKLQVDAVEWLGGTIATPTVTGVPEVDVTHAGGTAITVAAGIPEVKVASIAANAITATAINADAITAAKVAADVSAEIAVAVWDEATAGHVTAGTTGKALVDILEDTSTTLDDLIDTEIATIVTTVAAIEVDTQDIQARLPAALTADGNMKADTLRVGGTLQTAGDIIGDTNDIQTRLPAALVSGRMDSSVGAMAADVITATAVATGAIDALALATDAVDEIAAAILVTPSQKIATDASNRVDIGAVGGDTTTVTNMVRTFRSLRIDSCTTGSTTTAVNTANLIGTVADQFKGRLITFRDDTTTAALRGQQTDITASSLASPTVLTVTALSTAPASGDTFTIN